MTADINAIVREYDWSELEAGEHEEAEKRTLREFLSDSAVEWTDEKGKTLLFAVIDEMKDALSAIGVSQTAIDAVIFKCDVPPSYAIGGIVHALREEGFEIPTSRGFLDRALKRMTTH